MAAGDAELRKAFTEMQGKMVQLKMIDMEIKTLEETKNEANFTLSQVEKLTTDAKAYESVGRMFVLADIPTLKKNLKDKFDAINDKCVAAEKNKDYLKRAFKESESNIREMLETRNT